MTIFVSGLMHDIVIGVHFIMMYKYTKIQKKRHISTK